MDAENAGIRVDRASNKSSVTDVTKMVLGCDGEEAEGAIRKLLGAIRNRDQDFPRAY